jgi:hypothetical protein
MNIDKQHTLSTYYNVYVFNDMGSYEKKLTKYSNLTNGILVIFIKMNLELRKGVAYVT